MQALFLAAFNRGMKKLGESGRYQQAINGIGTRRISLPERSKKIKKSKI